MDNGAPKEKHPQCIQAATKLKEENALQTVNKIRIISEGGLPGLVQLLRSHEPSVLEDVLSTLRNVTVEPEADMHLFQDGAVAPLIELLGQQNSVAIQKAALGCLRNLSANTRSKQHMDTDLPYIDERLRRAVFGCLC